MRPFISSALAVAAVANHVVSAAPQHQHPRVHLQARTKYPFSKLVAFGDELSDNGNGSYAHGIAGNPETIYGFGTWTDGPVAVQYLASLLDVPLTDYAFGAANGGAQFGATINNTYTPSESEWNGQPVPSVHDQIIHNYTYPTAPSSIKESLQFIWTGQNDLTKHTDAFWEGDPQNAAFIANISERITWNAEYLVEQGAPYVFVANIYPKHRAPVTTVYLCQDGGCVDTWGSIIESANDALKTSLSKSKHASKFIYYDVYSYMNDLMDNKDQYGFTESLASFCDGDASDPNQKWDTCIAGSYTWEGAQKFYWMNYIQPTTAVYKLIAQDMQATINKFFGL
ncbi:hypothetical protein F5Y16DRAFT_369530 [Xylariaceae sp. FL0255]|nr:hypothetical protein F5Y16DRAFT_369530 [Xylariaceae sp. FL0255]